MKLACALLLLATLTAAAESLPPPRRAENLSLRQEVEFALAKGLGWLETRQHPQGFWSDPTAPAATALCLLAFLREPHGEFRSPAKAPHLRGALAFLRSRAFPGAPGQATLDTALALNAFAHARDPADLPRLRPARAFLLDRQIVEPATSPARGGFAQSSDEDERSDLFVTLATLEALEVFAEAYPDQPLTGPEIDLRAVTEFATRCQVPAASAPAPSAGGFVESPPETPPSAPPLPTGAATCAGLLTFLRAGLPVGDARVLAAAHWLRQNFTASENPGSPHRHYEYLHLLTKALSASGPDQFQTAEGLDVDWPREVALQLINTQNSAGAWTKPGAGKDPIRTTALALLTLELLCAQL